MSRRTPDAANHLYQPLQTVELSGVQFHIYGSMSWTVAEAKKRPWEDVRTAYIGLTGDTRDDVNRDQVYNVVAGQLQFSWARLKDRTDLVPTLEKNQQTRIENAVKSVEPPPKTTRRKVPVPPKTNNNEGASVSDQNTSENVEGNTNADTQTPTSEPTTDKKQGRTSIPTRGSMGKAAELINAGELREDIIVKQVQDTFPETKNVLRHVRYTAKLMDKKLVKGAAVEPADATAPAAPTE